MFFYIYECLCCFRQQRYKFLKAIHNKGVGDIPLGVVVSDYKDTNFWKQFTTYMATGTMRMTLFQTTKIQTFESNSQQSVKPNLSLNSCFRLQRYKLLKAIHNSVPRACISGRLFQTTKIQVFNNYLLIAIMPVCWDNQNGYSVIVNHIYKSMPLRYSPRIQTVIAIF